MLKNKSRLEVKSGEKVYEFACDFDAPIGEIYDALCQMKKFVIEKMVEFQKNEEEKEKNLLKKE